ncbi:MarC family protein [Maribellus mangrovi]|uniref:MarC family protein n=1 Tax=Maribellus mangrovi TaxID=3133146 RepID=UPI0030EF2728
MEIGILDIIVLLLILMGPLKPAIVFVTLTAKSDAKFRRRVALKTVVTATVVAVLFVLAGEFLLNAFHVSLPALKMAGGLILLLYALEMVIGGDSKKDDVKEDIEVSSDIAVFPLAMPLMATPQALVALTTVTASKPETSELLLIVGLIFGVMILNFFFLLGANKILGAIGPAALKVVSVIVGLLLAALAIQLMIWGLTDLGVLEALDAAH